MREAQLPWFREWVLIEYEARPLRSFQPLVLPGLLHTPAYAYAMCATGPPLPDGEIERIVEARIERDLAFLDLMDGDPDLEPDECAEPSRQAEIRGGANVPAL